MLSSNKAIFCLFNIGRRDEDKTTNYYSREIQIKYQNCNGIVNIEILSIPTLYTLVIREHIIFCLKLLLLFRDA